ncbi:MAG: hypothetical protein PHV23_05555 [Candidatus Gracilibacteria bacterium]|nr:hypothetical protein [Candidatus Gracilibacteria bacterium]
MLKKIIIITLITLSFYSCSKQENNDNIDNLNNGVIIDRENKVEELGVGDIGDNSTLEVKGGFSN